MQRRNFIQAAAWLAVGAAVAPMRAKGCQNGRDLDEIGLQLYTIRDAMQANAADALARVAQIGYRYVEGAGYNNGQLYGMTPSAFRQLLDDNDLRMVSGHAGLDAFRDTPEQVIAAFKAAGQRYAVLPWLSPEQRTAELYRSLPDIMNKAGRLCKEAGMQFAYHNHDFEFEPMADGMLPMDLLLKETDGELVKIELDIYWITKAGKSYSDYFQRYPGRFPLWHVKDIDNTPRQFFAPVGQGTIKWPEVFATSKQAGMEYFFVEQDQMPAGMQPFDAIAASYKYLKEMRY